MSIPVSIDPLGTLGAEVLPPGYTHVASVYFPLSTYCITPYNSESADEWVNDVQFGGTKNTGIGDGSQADNAYMLVNSATEFACRMAGVGTKRTQMSTVERRTYTINSSGIFADDIVLLEGTRSSYSGKWKIASLSWLAHGDMRFFNARLIRGGAIIADYIPVMDTEGNYSIYDKVTKEFLTVQGGTLQP